MVTVVVALIVSHVAFGVVCYCFGLATGYNDGVADTLTKETRFWKTMWIRK